MAAGSKGIVAVAFVLAIAASGCVGVRGRMPDTSALDSGALAPGVSTKADVLDALGAPAGYGMTRVDDLAEPRIIWYYEATKPAFSQVDIRMLLVFFDGEKYDGYLRFTSNGKINRYGP